MSAKYDCSRCPGYCCSYPVIVLTRRDVARIARATGLTPAESEAAYTRADHGYKRIMNRKDDEHYGRICTFFDTEERRCTIYKARPAICRDFPGPDRCGYYDFLLFERDGQKNEDYVSTTWHAED